MSNFKIITEEQWARMTEKEEQSGRFYLEWVGYEERDKRLFSVYRDERSGKLYGVPTVRIVHMGFNSNEEGKVEEFTAIVEREGACKASWGVTGRTKHLMLANELAKSLPQYDWEIDYDMYGCKATKRAEPTTNTQTEGDTIMKSTKILYTNTRDNTQYVLEPSITQGDKVCLIALKNGEHKFVAPSTLKRWYTKTEQPDSLYVTVCAFTGMPIGCYKVSSLIDGVVEIFTKAGNILKFDLHTGLQTNPSNPRFANRICWTV